MKVIFVVTLLVVFVSAGRFPSYIQKCHQNDPNLDQCSMNALNTIKDHLDDAIPEFGFPSMNPLILQRVALESDSSFMAEFSDVKIYNLKNAIARNLNVSLENNSLGIKLLFPFLRIMSKYRIAGRILILQLDANGNCDGNFTNVEADIKLQADRYKKGNKDYLRFFTMELSEKFEKPVFKFDGLFKNNPELNEQANKIVNENIEDVIAEMRPAIHLAIKQTFLGMIRRLFEKFSLQELFPA